jgi:hypothetical protein
MLHKKNRFGKMIRILTEIQQSNFKSTYSSHNNFNFFFTFNIVSNIKHEKNNFFPFLAY